MEHDHTFRLGYIDDDDDDDDNNNFTINYDACTNIFQDYYRPSRRFIDDNDNIVF